MTLTTPQQDIDRIVHGNHHDPFAILGMHTVLIPNGQSIVIRAYRPGAEKVTAKSDRAPVELIQHQDTGFFEAIVPNEQTHFLYELDISYPHNNQVITPDPYTFPPILSDYD
ncbi:MAG: 1,4-alpha-glucan branching enzyme, partial [Candidatus Latescibacteria bacterium]|nr:1,4-alpha-glucan branching enzyme [Candidatus Latescibacterota bacterium]